MSGKRNKLQERIDRINAAAREVSDPADDDEDEYEYSDDADDEYWLGKET